MADSDGEYVSDISDDDLPAASNIGGAKAHATRSSGPVNGIVSGAMKGDGGRRRAAWEDIQRSWDTVVEGADGNLSSTVEELKEAGKRQRYGLFYSAFWFIGSKLTQSGLLRDTTPLQRGIIRHVVLILDLSFAMTEKDLRPTRFLLTLRYAAAFVNEFFEQNPISQLGLIGMRDGLAKRISDLSGNAVDHLTALSNLRSSDPQGNPSLQNALEMARAALFHAPSHGTREILVISGALLSSDPGDIHTTIASLISDHIRVSVIGLAAQVAILSEICGKTHGDYNVAMHEEHFRTLFMGITTPPPMQSKDQNKSSLLMMGFPDRMVAKTLTLCACHSKLSRGGYLCSRCGSKVCSLPAECPACGLTLILSTHLARSYHHLFPLRNWREVSWAEATRSDSNSCFSCQAPFPPAPRRQSPPDARKEKRKGEAAPKTVSESHRYACTECGEHFCIDCDVFAHDVVHNCPGCQSNYRPKPQKKGKEKQLENGDDGKKEVPDDVTMGNGELRVDSPDRMAVD